MSLRGNALPDALRHEPADLHYFLVMLSDLILGDGKIKYRASLNKRMQRIQESIPTQGRDGNELKREGTLISNQNVGVTLVVTLEQPPAVQPSSQK